MKKITLIMLLLSVNLNAQDKPDLEIPETNKMLKESLALSQHFKDFSDLQKGSTNWRSVGAGGCQHSSIQAAIDDYTQSPLGLLGIPVEFRIATNKTYFENLVVGGNYDISLTGGYSDCSNMTGTPSNNQVLINGGFNGTVLKIQGVTTRRTMVFKNLRLLNGSNATGAGGGFLSDNSNVSLLLENVDIRNNTASHGAGIAIVGGDTDLLMNESLILGNVADYGGGIYCSGGNSSVNVANHSGIISNFANAPGSTSPRGGGGAYIDGCYFAIFTGSANNGSFTGMEGNSSASIGGAILAGGATIRLHGHQFCGSLGCLGDDINPVSFRSNQSNSSGAVISAGNSDVRINATWMEGNAGTTVVDVDSLTLERFQQPCWRNSECNLFENNAGVVIWAGFGDISISNTTFKNNPDGVFRFSGATFSSDYTSVNIESNFFFQNGSSQFFTNDAPHSIFRFGGALDVSLIHNTIVDNSSIDSTFLLSWTTAFGGQKPTFQAHSNIIVNPGASLLIHEDRSGNPSTLEVNISALITNETDSLLEINGVFNDAINFAGGDFISQTIPGEVLFVDRVNGDLHLSPNSRAIDYFNTPSRATVTYKDIDYQNRGFDDPNNQSPISSLFYFDLGADERIELPDLMFVDGFE